MGCSREQLIARLKELEVDFAQYEHPVVLTVEAQASHVGHLNGALTKNLFLKDKKHRFYIVSALADTKVDLKKLSQRLGLGKGGGLRMAPAEALKEILQYSSLPGDGSSTYWKWVLPECRYFNSLQSDCFSACFLSDMTMVISAPTGSGKAVLFELCIMGIFLKFISSDGKFINVKGILKTIYVAPSKALVQEKVRDWNQKFGPMGVNCLELTGDNENYNTRTIHDADIILTTPEKFDAITRYRIKDGGLSFFGDIALVLLHEVHLLNDPRGAALEAIVSRMKMLACKSEMKSSPMANVRFLAISATIPNIDDLGLGKK